MLNRLKQFFEKIIGKKSIAEESQLMAKQSAEFISELQKRYDAALLAVREGNATRGAQKADEKVKEQIKKSSMRNSAFTEEEMLKIRRDVVQRFNLKGINGFEQVQRGVLNTLRANNYFDTNGERKVVISENGMEVTINRGSIEETFGNGRKYESIPATFKILKLATIEQIPSIIEKATVVVEKEKNKYKNGKNKLLLI